jgi:hypothetical protein
MKFRIAFQIIVVIYQYIMETLSRYKTVSMFSLCRFVGYLNECLKSRREISEIFRLKLNWKNNWEEEDIELI